MKQNKTTSIHALTILCKCIKFSVQSP